MIAIEIRGNLALVRKKPPILTAGTVGLPVVFSFDGSWQGLSKTAVFRCGGVTRDVTDVEEKTCVPYEVMAQEGFLEIGVCGTAEDGSVVIPTVWAQVDRVFPGAVMSGVLSNDPPSPTWEALRQAVDTKLTAPVMGSVGQHLAVSALDSVGRPAAWETVTPKDTAHPLLLDWGEPIVDLTTREELYQIGIKNADDGRLLEDMDISEILVRYQMAGSSTATSRYMPGLAWIGDYFSGGRSVSFPCAASQGETYPCLFYSAIPKDSRLNIKQYVLLYDNDGNMRWLSAAPSEGFKAVAFRANSAGQMLGVGTNIKIWVRRR